MNISKALTYALKDRDWVVKLGVLALIFLVPVLSLAGTGYALEITRRVMKGSPKPLPEWDRLGRKWVDGLVLALVLFVYALPLVILVGLPVVLLVVPAALSGNGGVQGLTGVIEKLGSLVFAGVGCVAGLYGLLLSVLYPAIYVRYAQTGKFGTCFKLRELFSFVGRNSGAYFTALLVTLGISVAAGAAGGVVGAVPVLGWVVAPLIAFAAVAYGLVVSAHLFGQLGAGSAVRVSGKRAAPARSQGKARASAQGKRTSRASKPAKRKPAASAAARRRPGTASRAGRKPAASRRSPRRK